MLKINNPTQPVVDAQPLAVERIQHGANPDIERVHHQRKVPPRDVTAWVHARNAVGTPLTLDL